MTIGTIPVPTTFSPSLSPWHGVQLNVDNGRERWFDLLCLTQVLSWMLWVRAIEPTQDGVGFGSAESQRRRIHHLVVRITCPSL